MAGLISGSRGRGICHLPVSSSCPRTLAPVKSPRDCPYSPGVPQVQPAGQGPGAGSEGPGAGVRGHPARPSPAPAAPTAPRVCLEKKADQFVFIQNHLRSHFGEMKREKRASRAWPAGCPLVPGGALGGAPPPLPSARLPPPPTRAVAPGPRAAGLQAPGGQAELICMKPTLAAHLQRRN